MTNKQKLNLLLKQLPPHRAVELEREVQGAQEEGLDEEEAAFFALDHLSKKELLLLDKLMENKKPMKITKDQLRKMIQGVIKENLTGHGDDLEPLLGEFVRFVEDMWRKDPGLDHAEIDRAVDELADKIINDVEAVELRLINGEFFRG